MQEEILDAFRTPMFFIYMSLLLSFCVVSGSELGDRVEFEFQAYRLQHYEISGGTTVGSKSFRVLYEAVSLDANALRKCTIATWREIANRDITALLSNAVGALLIIIPNDVLALSPSDMELFVLFETKMSTVVTELAVYAVRSTEATSALLSEVSSSSQPSSAFQQLVQLLSANTFQLSSTSSPQTTPLTSQPSNIIAKLNSGVPSSPTIVFIAHYDTHAVFPDIGSGFDSNGSGVVALLELLSIMKKFYDAPSTRPPYHMMFVWTAAGKHNYLGTRTFVEDFQERNMEDKLELAVCLDSVGGPGALNVHVSKMPMNTSATHRFIRHLSFASNESANVIAKKINLNQPFFAWEHERLNVRRLAAVTISRLPAPEAPRRSLLDVSVDTTSLASNVRILAEAVLSHVLSLPTISIPRVTADSSLLSPHAVDKQRIEYFIRQVASFPRPVSDVHATDRVAANIAALASAYAPVRQQKVPLDGGVFPLGMEKIVAEKVKPAVFDLVLLVLIAGYLSLLVRIAGRAQSTIEGTLVQIRKAM